jgi:uncharacterized membrane protein YbhN (UPF0104 family)
MVLIGAGAFYLTFRGVDGEAFFAALSQVDLRIFAGGLLCFFAVHLGRSIRWGLLVQATAPRVTFRSYFSICSVGFFLINVLPFRLGELVRPYLLYEREDVPFGSGVATVVVERVLDIASLGLIFLGAVAFADLPDEPLSIAGQSVDIVSAGRHAILGAGVPAVLGLVVLAVMGAPAVALARRIAALFGDRVSVLVGRLLESFVEALHSLGSPGRALPILAWTLVTWAVNVLSILVMAKSLPFGADLGFWDGGAILSSICIFLIVPAPPLFAGVFELAVFVGVLLVAHDAGAQVHDQARAFAVLVHGSQFALLSSLGVMFLMIDRISVQRLLGATRQFRPGGSGDSPPA